MGYERTIPIATSEQPAWETIAARLRAAGESPVLRMIDGMPAFPDEIPEPTWNEIRIGLNGMMVTVRKKPTGYTCVSWGTDDPALKAAFENVVTAIATPGE